MVNFGVLISFFLLLSGSVFGQNLDLTLLEKVNLHRLKSLDPSLQTLTNSTDFVAVGMPVGLLIAGFAKNNTSLKKEGFRAGLATLGTYAVGYGLKKIVNRDRPYMTYPQIQNYQAQSGASFPSGSTALAFSAATSLSMSFPKWYVIVPSFAYATGVGYARLHLGAHYPTDVLAGAALGAGSALVSRKLNQYLVNYTRKRKRITSE
jgi:membrane-associated phospholipid phosphatase